MVLGWVEDVIKALAAPAARSAAIHSEAYFSPGDDCVARIERLFGEASCVGRRVRIHDYRRSTGRRPACRSPAGAAMRIITDNDKAHDLGSDIGAIEAVGVPVRIDRTPFHMHHKYAIFDGRRLLNGSYNWTRGAARDNQENVVVTDDRFFWPDSRGHSRPCGSSWHSGRSTRRAQLAGWHTLRRFRAYRAMSNW